MEKQMDISYVVYGVIFNHSFKLLDYWGEIADNLLYNNKFFREGFFTNISTQYTTERVVFNKNTGDSLTLTSNNLILKYSIKDKFTTDYNDFCKKINQCLIPDVLVKYNLVIGRTGVVFGVTMNDDELQKYSSKYFKDNVRGITDFKFSQKDTTKQGKYWAGTDDYINKIITVGAVGDAGDRGITYDYQVFYNPLRQDIRSVNDKFLNDGYSSLKNELSELK